MRTIISLVGVLSLVACGDGAGELFPEPPADAGPDLVQVGQTWESRYATGGNAGRTWGATEAAGNPACTLDMPDSWDCFFHGHNGPDTLDVVIKYWVNPQWVSSYDALVEGLVDSFVSNAYSLTSSGQAALPWQFQRLSGLTQPAGANVVIQAGYASGTLGTNVSQYVDVEWTDAGNCLELLEPSALPGAYHSCNSGAPLPATVATISVDFDSLETYMFQQGYGATARDQTRKHLLYHGMLAELGLGGTNSVVNSATRTTFSKTGRVTALTSSEELCRWRSLSDTIANNGNPGTTTRFTVSTNTCI